MVVLNAEVTDEKGLTDEVQMEHEQALADPDEFDDEYDEDFEDEDDDDDDEEWEEVEDDDEDDDDLDEEEDVAADDSGEEDVAAVEADQEEPAADVDEIAKFTKAEMACAEAESTVEELKAELKQAKAHFENCVTKLRALVRAATNDRNRPLLTGVKDMQPRANVLKSPPEAKAETAVEVVHADKEDEDEDPEAWKDTPLEDLPLPNGILDTLYGENINTIGGLIALQTQISLGKEKWPKGIGSAKVSKIEDTVISWLSSRQ